jgi:hypothetical protein
MDPIVWSNTLLQCTLNASMFVFATVILKQNEGTNINS